MNVACFSVLLNVECCKMLFSQEQRVFIITHYFCNLGERKSSKLGLDNAGRIPMHPLEPVASGRSENNV